MLPPGEVYETGQLHQVMARIGENYLELLVGIRAREAYALHAQVDRHDLVLSRVELDGAVG
jgi:hypothetical protein